MPTRHPMAEEFGLRVKVQRVTRRLSRAQLEDLAGFPPRRVEVIERGDHVVNLEAVVALRQALDCPWEALLDGLEAFGPPARTRPGAT